MADYTIWHNPKCSTSRFVLQALQEAGVDVEVRDYLAQPPSTSELRDALDRLAIAPRALLRRRNTPHDDLGLDDPALSDDALITAMAKHPALIERPVVFGPKDARLCRPKETVFDLLAG
ncbi:arsenate reductase (glutaredoxin) [Paracoccus sp. WLY502]|uniref:arsenate reductase (glutaredoxin) n=1 Tax=Paracoccus yibinensis TaxID=3068891 RepID=UPI00279699CD|nr:arsenate reductase (glutaredoxin) [Paracoccus sp. WLY502]MDQ1901036.1 arsenate reductase (glutaredoxin) [Paracoccus sp. WLY502]